MAKSLRAIVSGTGLAVPAETLSNDYFAEYLDTSDEWITTRTGIKGRYRASDNETTVSLAKEASKKALADAGLRPADIDLIIFATVTPDTVVPAAACWLQAELEMPGIPAFDINAACAGLTYGMVQAAVQIESGLCKHVLVVGAETLTKITDYQDRNTCVLFGDAASAVIMSDNHDADRGMIYHSLGAEGTGAKLIWMPAGGSRMPASELTTAERLHFLRMNGREVYKFAVVKFNRLVKEALEATGHTPEDLDLVIPHQSNLRIIESARERLGLSADKFVINIDRFGNTSAASVGLALDEARRDDRIKQGDLVIMVALGAGLTWGSILMRM